MLQHIIVFIVVAICIFVVIRLILRVLAGKQSTCSLCNECDIRSSCDKEPCEEPPESCPERNKTADHEHRCH